ncbi:DNA topoisomerase III [Halomonas sp. DP5N14-9]|uniref:DNA topoisomerase III n=1 Tax=Halomonas sp. DP5N14-9 TaxID=2859075 RepID=UPI001C991847|nr:DNA topoisomerase III [Halomonas sp. DP5N14-9]MBY5940560.1 DNA topoisomerase III [Halomonas sp. DP5N14-9]
MDLYICEKPTQAKDLAQVLRITKRAEGYLHDGGDRIVTWAFGHLLELNMPDAYDPALKSWNIESLPIAPDQWRYHVKKSGAKQFKVIKELLGKASQVFIATDHDREGEAIARSLMDRSRYQGTVKRVCLRALDETSIRNALADIRPGDETVPLYHAAMARSRADWLIGMNMSRLYTVLARKAGYDETLHVGRVITPTVALVCQRDKEIANFTPAPYYVLSVDVSVQSGAFRAVWEVPEELADDQGRCINKAFAEQVGQQVRGVSAIISTAETKPGKESAPLPFDLSSLQQYAAKRWGYTAQQVLDGAQALYETWKATTYPRTDSRYLPESQRKDIADTLQGLMLTDQTFSGLVAGADPQRSSRAYNDAKVTAHHAIIPTPARTNISKMSELEFNLYDCIRRFYVAQFYAPFEFNRTKVQVSAGQHLFNARGKTPLKQGWKVIFNSDLESSPEDEGESKDENPEQDQLPPMRQGEPAVINGAELADKFTRPPPHFTEATLLAAMENIARFVTEPRFKQILKDTAGLGTPATRAGTIQGAVDRGYLQRKKKTLHASDKAHALVTILPEALKSPGMTAAWEQQLEKIAAGEARMTTFMEQITGWVSTMVTTVKTNAEQLTQQDSGIKEAFADARGSTYPCFTCGSPLKRIKGKNGFFWGCQSPSCKATFPDSRGKPQQRTKPEDGPDCPDCGKAMRLRSGKAPGKTRATKFWGCSGYPECKGRLPYKRKRTSAA